MLGEGALHIHTQVTFRRRILECRFRLFQVGQQSHTRHNDQLKKRFTRSVHDLLWGE